MPEFKSFDNFEQMQEYMAKAEEEANNALHPVQIELRDDVEHTRYWCRPYAELGILIFGEAWSVSQIRAKEDAHITDRKTEVRARGYLFGYAYSVVEPDGEVGDTHVANVFPISEAAFEEARAHGWKAVKADRLAELMVPAEVLAKQTTPTLNAELAAADAMMREHSDG